MCVCVRVRVCMRAWQACIHLQDNSIVLILNPHTHARTNVHTGASETDINYVTFIRRSHGSSHGSEMEWESELSDVNDEDPAPHPSLYKPLEPQGSPTRPKLATVLQRNISDNQIEISVAEEEEGGGDLEDTLNATLNSISHSDKLAQELDEASQQMWELTEACDDIFDAGEDKENLVTYREGGVVRRRSKTISGDSLRHSVLSTISLSEPDLTVVGLPASSASPRSSGNPYSVETIRVGPHRQPQSHDSLEQSSSDADPLSSSMPSSHKFLVSSPKHKAYSASTEDRFLASIGVSPSASPHAGKGKHERRFPKLVRRSNSSNSSKKSSTLPTTTGSKVIARSQGRSSSVAVFSATDLPKTPSKGFLKGFRKNVKKLVKTPDALEVDGPVPLARDKSPGAQASTSVKRSRTFMRKNSFSSEMALSTSPLAPVDEMYHSAQQLSKRESTTRGNTISLVSQIFSILTLWQNEHFEVRGRGLRSYFSIHGNCN